MTSNTRLKNSSREGLAASEKRMESTAGADNRMNHSDLFHACFPVLYRIFFRTPDRERTIPNINLSICRLTASTNFIGKAVKQKNPEGSMLHSFSDVQKHGAGFPAMQQGNFVPSHKKTAPVHT